ncbi:MAG: hypothetical protein V3W28_06045 [Thermoplasmata archaeon]
MLEDLEKRRIVSEYRWMELARKAWYCAGLYSSYLAFGPCPEAERYRKELLDMAGFASECAGRNKRPILLQEVGRA